MNIIVRLLLINMFLFSSQNSLYSMARGGRDLSRNVMSSCEQCPTLHDAADNGCDSCIQRLLDGGADPNAQDDLGYTPLHCATRYGKESCIEKLLSAPTIIVDAQNRKGNTPLHIAGDFCHIPIIRLLFLHKANVNAKNTEGNTPLHVVVLSHFDDSLEALIEAGADVNACNNAGATPLSCVSVISKTKLLILLRNGADITKLHPYRLLESLQDPSKSLINSVSALITNDMKTHKISSTAFYKKVIKLLPQRAIKGRLPKSDYNNICLYFSYKRAFSKIVWTLRRLANERPWTADEETREFLLGLPEISHQDGYIYLLDTII